MQPLSFLAGRAAAAQTMRYILESSKELEEALSSPDPRSLLIPDMSFYRNPSIATIPSTIQMHSGEEASLDFVKVVTRPRVTSQIFARVQRSFEQQQQTTTGVTVGVLRSGTSNCMAPGMMLRGCKGIGKSFIMILTAMQLLIRNNRQTRVVFVGNCNEWSRCSTNAHRKLFLAEAIAQAFVDSTEVLDIIDRWQRQVIAEPASHWPTDVVSLLGEIRAYCRREDLNVAFLFDRVDSLATPGTSSSEIQQYLRFIKRQPPFTILLAASDDQKAADISQSLGTADLSVEPRFTSDEAVLLVRSHCVGRDMEIWQIKELINRTWRHPGQISRICKQMGAMFVGCARDYCVGDIYAAILELSDQPVVDFEPKPFSSYLTGSLGHTYAETIGQSVLDVLRMSSTFSWPADTNYMSIVESPSIFPCPQIARGVIELCCRPSDVDQSVDRHLSQMQMVVYQALT
ncbi:hypothetical protein LPJ53_003262 [Coemansia erecta]|uniref:Uncharacterized protein n=1 Tax=Coemansia erecta TaxID=147472 RepID=A0A9W7Y1Q4_9FUNG|nr:hypothetical protein LPJ53_003262 [Coemansia erecta]